MCSRHPARLPSLTPPRPRARACPSCRGSGRPCARRSMRAWSSADRRSSSYSSSAVPDLGWGAQAVHVLERGLAATRAPAGDHALKRHGREQGAAAPTARKATHRYMMTARAPGCIPWPHGICANHGAGDARCHADRRSGAVPAAVQAAPLPLEPRAPLALPSTTHHHVCVACHPLHALHALCTSDSEASQPLDSPGESTGARVDLGRPCCLREPCR